MQCITRSRRGGSGGSLIALMIVAVIILAGYLFYKTTSEKDADEVAVTPEPETKAEPDSPLAGAATARDKKAFAPSSIFEKAEAKRAISDDDALLSLFDLLNTPNDQTVRIRLKKKVDEATLRKIAALVKKNQASAKRVDFLAPGANDDAAPIATANLDGGIRLTTHDLSDEAVDSVLKKARGLGSLLVGAWRGGQVNSPIVMIYQQNGELYLESTYPDGSSTKERVTVRFTGPVRTYRAINPKVPGVFYRLGTAKVLEMHDKSGPVSDFNTVDLKK
jgi:hypothetical protein